MAQVREVEEALERKQQRLGGDARPPVAEGDGRGILPFRVEPVADGADATGRAGLPVVVEVLRAFPVDKRIEQHLPLKERRRGLLHGNRHAAVPGPAG
jgi:hypothetical protein